jgi:hypothetical protein
MKKLFQIIFIYINFILLLKKYNCSFINKQFVYDSLRDRLWPNGELFYRFDENISCNYYYYYKSAIFVYIFYLNYFNYNNSIIEK